MGVQTSQADLRQYRARLMTHWTDFPIHPNGRSLENLQEGTVGREGPALADPDGQRTRRFADGFSVSGLSAILHRAR